MHVFLLLKCPFPKTKKIFKKPRDNLSVSLLQGGAKPVLKRETKELTLFCMIFASFSALRGRGEGV